jgi:hypothetical protein
MLEHFTAKLPCPACKVGFDFRLEDIQPGAKTTCPSCQANITFSGDDGRRAQEALSNFERTLEQVRATMRGH